MDINKVIIIVLLLVAIVGYIRLYRHYRRNIKKVTFLFDAIDNGDFSFNFPTEKGFKEDVQLVTPREAAMAVKIDITI